MAEVGLGLFVIGVILGLSRLVSPIGAFSLAALGGAASLIALLAAVIRRDFGASLLLGLPGAIYVLLVVISSTRYPRIHDVTTDSSGGPAFKATPTGKVSQDDLALIAQHYPDIRPLELSGTPIAALSSVRQKLEHCGFKVSEPQPGLHAGLLEGFEESRVFGFRDVFVIEFRAGIGTATTVHIRSRSLVGKNDFGVNARRIKRIAECIQGQA